MTSIISHTAEQITPKRRRYDHARWCSCGNASRSVSFFDDDVSDVCPKHHWCCDDCGKVVQVG